MCEPRHRKWIYCWPRTRSDRVHQKHNDEFYISIRPKLTDSPSEIKLERRREPRKNPEVAHRSPLTALIDLRLVQRNEGERSNDRSIRITVHNGKMEEIFCFDLIKKKKKATEKIYSSRYIYRVCIAHIIIIFRNYSFIWYGHAEMMTSDRHQVVHCRQ